ncbi:MAG: FecR domain-containing protein [Flavobacteriales bacterium]
MDRNRLSELLKKYDAGLANEEEIKEIESFADQRLNLAASWTLSHDDRSRIHDELRERISVDTKSSRSWLQLAASIAVLLGTALGLWFGLGRETILMAETGVGELKTITLEDGTQVNLNSGSTLEYPESFASDHRDVILHGEAQFKVANDKSRPFTVQSNGVYTQVLGTTFNVNAFSEDSLVVVSLLEGSVKVSGDAGERIIEPMQEATFDLKSHELTVHAFDSLSVTAWLEGDVVFERMSFDRLCKFMMRKYSVKVSLEQPSMKEYTISGKFTQPSLEVLLASTTAAKGLDYKQVRENEYLIFQPE